jgi:hypothetical protein
VVVDAVYFGVVMGDHSIWGLLSIHLLYTVEQKESGGDQDPPATATTRSDWHSHHALHAVE